METLVTFHLLLLKEKEKKYFKFKQISWLKGTQGTGSIKCLEQTALLS